MARPLPSRTTRRKTPERGGRCLSSAEPQAPRGRQLWRTLASLAAGLGALVLAGFALRVDPRQALHSIAAVPLWGAALLCASALVVLALQALRWHGVMGPLTGLRYSHALRAQLVGTLFNAVLPARGGDLLRVQYLGRRTGKSRATLLGTEIVDRWLDWWGWIPSFLVLAFFSSPPAWLWRALALFGAVLAAWGAAMVLLTRSGWRPRSERLARILGSLSAGLQPFRSRRIWLLAILIAPLPWLWESLVIAFAARLFGIELTLVQSYSVLIAFNLATVVPSPGAVGTVEAGGTAALALFGFDHSRALAFLFVYHFTQLVPGMVGGALVLAFEGERLFGKRAPPLGEVQSK